MTMTQCVVQHIAVDSLEWCLVRHAIVGLMRPSFVSFSGFNVTTYSNYH
jgi:hypothetical protein